MSETVLGNEDLAVYKPNRILHPRGTSILWRRQSQQSLGKSGRRRGWEKSEPVLGRVREPHGEEVKRTFE